MTRGPRVGPLVCAVVGLTAAATGCRCDDRSSASARLMAKVVSAEGDAQRTLRVVDRTTDAPCRFEPLGGGQPHRCLPQGVGRRVYADAACRDELVQTEDKGWVRLFPTRDYARVGAKRSVTQVFHRDRGGGCVGPATEASATHREVRSVQSASTFVRGQVSHRQVSDRLSQPIMTVDGDKLSLVTDELWDATLETPCVLERADDAVVCRPVVAQRVHDAEVFVDDSCRHRAVMGAPARADRLAEYVTASDDRTVVRLTPIDASTALWSQRDGKCVPTTVDAKRYALMMRASPVGRERWARLERRDVGRGRLRVVQAVGSDGTLVATVGRGALVGDTARPTFFDTELKLDCTPAWMSDALRCVPTAPFAARPALRFADAACKAPAVTWPSYDSPRFFTLVVEPAARDGLPAVEVYAAGAAARGFVRSNLGGCDAAPTGGPVQRVEHPSYRVGEAVAAERFAPVRWKPSPPRTETTVTAPAALVGVEPQPGRI